MDITNPAYAPDEEVYGKKIHPIPTESKKDAVGISDVLYDNIVNTSFSSPIDISALSSLTSTATTRNELYNVYDTMCEDGRIGAVVKTYAEDATEKNDEGKIVWATSANSDISYLINYYIDSFNINKNIYKWAYSLAKYGDLYVRLYRESEYEDALFSSKPSKTSLTEDVKIKAFSKNDRYAHYIEMVKNPAEMFELTKFGKTVGFIQSPVDSPIVKNNTGFDFSTFHYNFNRDDIKIYPPTEYVHAAIEDDIGRFDETVNIFLDSAKFDPKRTKYDPAATTDTLGYSVRKGNSILAKAYKTWRELQLLETSVLLNRVTKSSIVRLINVEVGDMPKENVAKVMQRIKQMIEQKAAINTGAGMNEYTNPGPIENNVYIPTHEGVGTVTTTQVGGDVDVKSLADLEWYINSLYTALQAPKQYFNQSDDGLFDSGKSLSIISSRFAKTIKHIQTALIQMITDIINLVLLDKGLDEYINNFEIHMQPPVTQEDIDRRDSQNTQVQLTSDIMTMLGEYIDDPVAKLKILKNMIKNIITDDSVIQEIDAQIEIMETQPQEYSSEDEEFVEEEPEEDSINSEDTEFDFSDFDDSSNYTTEEPNEQINSETEFSEEPTKLPTPEELGIDVNDSSIVEN